MIVTLHRTENLDTPVLRVHLDDIATELALVDRIIVHQGEDADRLRALGVERIEVIPIGARQFDEVTTTTAREVLGVEVPEGTFVVATYGFLLPHKGTLQLIQAIGAMRDQGISVALLAVCALHTDPTSAAYEEECIAEIERLDLGNSVRLVTEFLHPQVSHLLLSVADLIVLPYHESAESSSAALRFVLPVSRPVIASDIGIFHDARESLKLVESPPSAARLAAAMVQLMQDADERNDLALRARLLAHRSSLNHSVDEHSRVYREVRAARAAR